ncbi:porin [Aquincola sp. MAHUQ-54]|uniref:Porin n=1 Tax=Aquincola agrisoli TaxID=3119538 RepID=A0AAW9QF55_9BURK
MKPHAIAAAILPLALGAPTAFAGIQLGEHVTLSGFGTLGAVVTDNDEAQFRTESRQPRGADDSVDFGVDSKLGVQANVKFNETFSAVGQILTSRRMSDRPVVEWLYGQAQLPAGFSVKLGRMVLPTFMISDSRAVGYASHWLRAPQEVYGSYPPSYFDGGQLQYRNAFGPVNATLQLSIGRTETDIHVGGVKAPLEMSKLRSLNLLLESGNWLVRLGHTVAPDAELKGLGIPPTDDQFSGLGLQYDNGTALVMAEYAVRRQGGGKPFESDGWYLSGGWRFGAWMPYATVSRFTPKGVMYGTRQKDSTDAVGVRWDAMKNVAIKAQVQRVDSAAAFVKATPGFLAKRPEVNVYGIAVDFVF